MNELSQKKNRGTHSLTHTLPNYSTIPHLIPLYSTPLHSISVHQHPTTIQIQDTQPHPTKPQYPTPPHCDPEKGGG